MRGRGCRGLHVTLDEIRRIVASGESETLEFKETTGRRREAAITLCAMLNHQGGTVLFGVTPGGKISGQQVSDRTIEEVSAEVAEIDPPVFPTIAQRHVDGGKSVVSVSTGRGISVPYMYRGSAYRRVGNTNLKMSADEYNRVLFERMHGQRRWENEPAEGWSVADLDEEEIMVTVRESIRQNRLSEPSALDIENLLTGLNLMRDGVLLRAAVVLFGKRERMGPATMPQCLLRVARFRGRGMSEFDDNRQFYGNAFTLYHNAQTFMMDHLPIASHFVPGQFERVDEPLYPTAALREALANALCHRDYLIGGGSIGVGIYDDRLEITSTGPLPHGLTPERLFMPHPSQPWNPLIADVFYRRGIIEKWGSGTLKMAELMAQAGLPKPEIEDANDHVTVRFRPSRYIPPRRVEVNLTARQQAILALLHDAEGGLAISEIHGKLGEDINNRTIRRDLIALRDYGMITQIGQRRGTRWMFMRS